MYNKEINTFTEKLNKMLNSGDNIAIVSHNDLDGYGCTILLEKAFKLFNKSHKITVINKSYNDLQDETFINYLKKQKNLIITDLNLPRDLMDILNKSKKKNIINIDHHLKTTVGVSNKYDWEYIDINNSATMSIYNMLTSDLIIKTNIDKDFSELINYKDLALRINDYDLFVLKYDDSIYHNIAFNSNKQKYLNHFKNTFDIDLTIFNDEIDYIKKYIKTITYYCNNLCSNVSSIKFNTKNKEYIGLKKDLFTPNGLNFNNETYQILKDINGNICLILPFIKEYSIIANIILKENSNIDYIAIRDTNKISLRSRTINVQEIASKLGGGGHKLASGFIVNNNVLVDYSLYFNAIYTKNE